MFSKADEPHVHHNARRIPVRHERPDERVVLAWAATGKNGLAARRIGQVSRSGLGESNWHL